MFVVFFFKQKTAYEITYGDWSSDVCSSDLLLDFGEIVVRPAAELHDTDLDQRRSEERRVGKECRRLCRSRGSADHETKKSMRAHEVDDGAGMDEPDELLIGR